jgi:hypothetical protein
MWWCRHSKCRKARVGRLKISVAAANVFAMHATAPVLSLALGASNVLWQDVGLGVLQAPSALL